MNRKEITDLSYSITGYAIKVHKTLGPGLLENIYEKCLRYELEKSGYKVEHQMVVPVIYDELEFDYALRVDLFVEELVVVEIKSCKQLLPVHEAQILTYMKLLNCPQGLLINFNRQVS